LALRIRLLASTNVVVSWLKSFLSTENTLWTLQESCIQINILLNVHYKRNILRCSRKTHLRNIVTVSYVIHILCQGITLDLFWNFVSNFDPRSWILDRSSFFNIFNYSQWIS
jgi:hypothetical protein